MEAVSDALWRVVNFIVIDYPEFFYLLCFGFLFLEALYFFNHMPWEKKVNQSNHGEEK